MNYQETLDWLFNQLPMYQKVGGKALKKDLSNTLLLMDYLNHPEKALKAIHIAGTNGKGSTSHMLASVLQEQGYKVGLYTSPHMLDFRERIKINGIEISEQYVIDFVAKHQSFFKENQLSFFEMTVGLAFDYFKNENTDIVIVETGLGGRLDSTNVISPLVSVITNIGLDHTQFLGDTLSQIASEKAGIIKDNIPVVIGEYHEATFSVFDSMSKAKKARLHKAFDLPDYNKELDLKGRYQYKNVKSVIQTIQVLQELGWSIDEDSVTNGLVNVIKNTGLLGRYQIVQNKPRVICDTAHNKEGLSLVMEQLSNEKCNQLHIVFGMVSDKDISEIVKLLPPKAEYYFTQPSISRALQVDELLSIAKLNNLKGRSYDSVGLAFQSALYNSNSNDLIYIGGSTFVVADFLSLFNKAD